MSSKKNIPTTSTPCVPRSNCGRIIVPSSADGKLDLSTYVDLTKGAFCGPDIPAPASYAWRLQGHTLMLAAQKDRCADRDSTLAGKWTRR